jgi:prephenate dehydratase
MTKINIEELNDLINELKSIKSEIFIKVDKTKIIETYKNEPDTLLKILKGLINPYIPVKDIQKRLTKKYDTKYIKFILNHVQL